MMHRLPYSFVRVSSLPNSTRKSQASRTTDRLSFLGAMGVKAHSPVSYRGGVMKYIVFGFTIVGIVIVLVLLANALLSNYGGWNEEDKD